MARCFIKNVIRKISMPTKFHNIQKNFADKILRLVIIFLKNCKRFRYHLTFVYRHLIYKMGNFGELYFLSNGYSNVMKNKIANDTI